MAHATRHVEVDDGLGLATFAGGEGCLGGPNAWLSRPDKTLTPRAALAVLSMNSRREAGSRLRYWFFMLVISFLFLKWVSGRWDGTTYWMKQNSRVLMRAQIMLA